MNHILLFLLILSFSGCSPSQLDESKEAELNDVKYGNYDRNRMDIYLPANRTANTPFVVNIHGGAWTAGDKSYDTSLSKYLLSKGIAVANINYRYANNTDTHLPNYWMILITFSNISLHTRKNGIREVPVFQSPGKVPAHTFL